MWNDSDDSEFELEHWKSRAETAEKELKSARIVLATVRHYVMQTGDVKKKFEKVKLALGHHDSEYWTIQHRDEALQDAIAFVMEADD